MHGQLLALQRALRLEPDALDLLGFAGRGRDVAFEHKVAALVLIGEMAVLDVDLADHRRFSALVRRDDFRRRRRSRVLAEAPVRDAFLIAGQRELRLLQAQVGQNHVAPQQRHEAHFELNAGCLEQRRSVLGGGAQGDVLQADHRRPGPIDPKVADLDLPPQCDPCPRFHLATEAARSDVDDDRRDSGNDQQDQRSRA